MALVETGIEPSVGRVGDSHDKAMTETVNRLFKAGVIHRGGPRRTCGQIELATLEWIDWFNIRHLLATINDCRTSYRCHGLASKSQPAEAKANYSLTLEAAPLAE